MKEIFLKYFDSIALARLAQETLKSQGIESLIQNSGIKFPGDLGDSFGAELYVMDKDYKKAKEVLGIEGA